jgi:hypothetical protein
LIEFRDRDRLLCPPAIPSRAKSSEDPAPGIPSKSQIENLVYVY